MNEQIKNILRPVYATLVSCGIDFRKISNLRFLPMYISHRLSFKKKGGVINHTWPIIEDYSAKAGVANGHYFHQDLLVAQFIESRDPDRHLDVGSRIDGFVAHVASFREIEVSDIRELDSISHKNIKFIKMDFTEPREELRETYDSVSCLHAIEHFGLGRYGDKIDPSGHIKGVENLIDILKYGGVLYISFPIAQYDAVHFNAHRIFAPKSIFTWTKRMDRMKLVRFDYVNDYGELVQNVSVEQIESPLKFGCGIYTFQKSS